MIQSKTPFGSVAKLRSRKARRIEGRISSRLISPGSPTRCHKPNRKLPKSIDWWLQNPSEDQKSIILTTGLTDFSAVSEDCQTLFPFCLSLRSMMTNNWGRGLKELCRGKAFASRMLEIPSLSLRILCPFATALVHFARAKHLSKAVDSISKGEALGRLHRPNASPLRDTRTHRIFC